MGMAAKFIVTQMFKVNIFDNGDFACLQIPTDYDVGITLKLNKETYVRRAHRRNIAVQYWTINDEETMRELIELGCDCIMTDDPLLLKSVLDTYR
jgi:glycerophosphoryl diester phosphodiesterase